MQSRFTIVALAVAGAVLFSVAGAAAQPADAAGSDAADAATGDARVPAAEPADGPDDAAANGPDGAASPDAAGAPTTVIDFGEDEAFGPGEVMTSREADDVKFGTLLRSRYRRLLDARDDDAPAPPAPPRSRVAVAVSTGVAIASLSADVAADVAAGDGEVGAPGARIGAAVGATVDVGVAGSVGIAPGLWYVAKGATMADGGALHYLTVPVQLRYRVGSGSYRVDLGAGPAVGLALSSRVAGMDVQRWELGAIATAGVHIPTGPGAVALAVRYDHGLTDVVAGSGARNRVLAITAGYAF